MTIDGKNPLEILGISLDEARRLGSLEHSSRQASLSILRRYYATLYHPDITGNTADTKRVAEINGAIDELEDDGIFHRSLSLYTQAGRLQRSTGSQEAWSQQIDYFRRQAEEAVEEADLLRTGVAGRDSEIEALQKLINERNNEIWELQKNEARLRRTRVKSELLKEEREQLLEYRENLLARIKSLNSILLSGASNSDVPENRIGLNQVGGNRYVIGTHKKKRILRISPNLIAVEEGRVLKYRSLSETLLLGGLTEPHMFDRVSPLSKGYGPVLFNLQPYLGIGMYPVVEMKDAEGNPKPLYVYGKIRDIIPVGG